jgi:hypothetical protein
VYIWKYSVSIIKLKSGFDRPTGASRVNIDYIRGFLLTDREQSKLPEDFSFVKNLCGKYHLFVHKLLNIWQSGGNCREIYLLGFAIDVRDGAFSETCATRLYEALCRSERSFFDVLDFISGRYVVIYITENKLGILNDACGLKSIFYSKERFIAGSHARLVAEAQGLRPSSVFLTKEKNKIKYQYGWPGLTTPYDGVIFLSPNTLLDFSSMTTRRYFPREPLKMMSADAAAAIVGKAMSIQMPALLASGKKLLVGLTAGIDSRVSFAATFQCGRNIEYYTYWSTEAQNIDVAVSKHIASVCGLNHMVFVSEILECMKHDFRQFRKALARNTFYENPHHIKAFLYRIYFGEDAYFHIRSNLAEIGRAFYRQKKKRHDVIDVKQMVNIYNPKYSIYHDVVDAFSEFQERAWFDSSLFFNYDPYDLFYWEFRMAVWHSHIVTESDVAFDTHVLYNSREIFKTLMSVPLEDRLSAAVFKKIVKDALPLISDIPINPETFTADKDNNHN